MADTKVSALTADASPTTDDLIYTVNNPGGTPASRKVTIANLATLLFASPTFTGAVTGASANFSSTCSAAALHSTGAVVGVDGTFSGSVTGASASFTATCAAVTLVASGAVNGASANFTSTCSAAGFHATGLVTGASANFTSTCAAVTLVASGLVSGASANFTATCSAAALSITGNIINNGTTYTAGAASQVGYQGVPVNSQTAAYEAVAADVGKVILHATSDNNARTFTIPSSATVAFAVGSVLTFINQINTVTIAITTDTMKLAGAGTTGSRTLAANGIATAVKLDSSGNWLISGTGLT